MVMAAISPGSIISSPDQVNPYAKTEVQNSTPQAAEDAKKYVKSQQTDTVTISAQALKMADDKSSDAKEIADKKTERADESAKDLMVKKKADQKAEQADQTAKELAAKQKADKSYSMVSYRA